MVRAPAGTGTGTGTVKNKFWVSNFLLSADDYLRFLGLIEQKSFRVTL